MNTIKLKTGETLNLEDLSSLTAWLRQHISVTKAQIVDNAEPPAGVEITFRFDTPLDGWINDGDLTEIATMTVLSDLAEEPQKAQNKTIPFPVMEAAPDLDPYDGIHTEAQGEAKAYAKLVFDSFAAEVPEMWRYLTGEFPNDAACLKYGRETLEKAYTDKAELQKYLFMWLAFYVGFGAGTDLTAKLLQMPDEPQQP